MSELGCKGAGGYLSHLHPCPCPCIVSGVRYLQVFKLPDFERAVEQVPNKEATFKGCYIKLRALYSIVRYLN
jgi:hypothetical protein